ncbi:efp [Spodoptera litura granulovirus]|uniref:Efp n=1 Tax=Spodoptera litura granulovirus TaxID=359919 RepID=A5IZM6_9BBAC|nr:efp [Spodoptera litura granulovirus]ABQ51967.1 efp [Spodoptera litura granulovirus]
MHLLSTYKCLYYYFTNKMFITLLIIFFALSRAEYVEVDTFVSPGGLHYEYNNKLIYAVNTWNFVLNVNFTVLKERIDDMYLLLNANLTIDDTCKEYGYDRRLNYYLTTKIPNLYQTHDSIGFLLIHKRINSKVRVKRNLFNGAFNFVGRFDKYLFGVMDDYDAQVLYELVKSDNSTKIRVKSIATQTLKLAESMDSIRHKVSEMEPVSCYHIQRRLDYIHDNLEEVEFNYNKIIEGIYMALNDKQASPFIVHPDLILLEMKGVSDNFDDGETEWVIEPKSSNMHYIMSLVQCHVFLVNENEIMFVVQSPRIYKTKFELYKILSIPNCNKDHVCKFLTPRSEYVAFDDATNKTFVRLNDISACKQIQEYTVCYGSFKIDLIKKTTDCDVKLFFNNTVSNCDVRAGKFYSEIFQNLNQYNRWLYMVQKPTALKLNCGNGMYDKSVLINGTGVVTLKQYCKVKTGKSILITRHSSNDDERVPKIIVSFNFTPFYLPETNNAILIKNLDFDTLSSVKTSLQNIITSNDKEIKVIEDDNSNSNWYLHLISDYTVDIKIISYVIIFILISAVIVYVKPLICCRQTISRSVF